MTKIFKVLAQSDWEVAVSSGWYAGSDDDVRDGFIHFSSADQLEGTLAKHFAGQSGLVLISFDPADFGTMLKWEKSRGGALFPHVYGKVDTTLAVESWLLPLDEEGIPQIPAESVPG